MLEVIVPCLAVAAIAYHFIGGLAVQFYDGNSGERECHRRGRK